MSQLAQPVTSTTLDTTNPSSQQQQSQSQPQHPSPLHHNDDLAAAEALTQLVRNQTPPSDSDMVNSPPSSQASPTMSTNAPTTMTSPHGSLPLPLPLPQPRPQQHPIVSTVSMVAKHPLVKNAVRYYETSKRNYPKFNYAAGIVEKAALPVVNKIEVNLNSRHQLRQQSTSSTTPSSVELTPIVSNDDGDHKQRKRRLGENEKSTGTSDTKKRIQFCLHVLRLANESINSKINFLQDKVAETEIAVKEEREKLQQQQLQDPSQSETQKTKTEIVTTVKKIIHLISNFRPSSLSTESLTPIPSNGSTSSQEYELKNAIRDIVLHLPASLQRSGATSPGGTHQVANDRVLIFARESLEMISKLTQVFNEQLSKAETWVGGDELEQQQQQQEQQEKIEDEKVQSQDVMQDSDDEMNSGSTRCSSAEPEGITNATKRMKLDCPTDN